ncbi:Ankyrin repeat [Trinorchestia longiramus]|nr:Ankyrin repeat [Trinorchestia longiramus]
MFNTFRKKIMWRSKDDAENFISHVLDELHMEVRTMAPGARLCYAVRHNLEKLPREARQHIVNRTMCGFTPLFIACRRGLVEVVEYLCTTCGCDMEIRCSYEVHDDRSNHVATPLWAAAVAGHEQVVRVLVSHGANVNSVSDTGSTPARSACFMSHVNIVKYLVESGADVLKPNYNGGTCLINSVQSVELCRFLLDHGADINAQDVKNKTAMHYAVEEDRYETVKLLLERGAVPYIKSRLGDDAIQTACVKGALQIFSYFIHVLNLPASRVTDGFEVLGSTYLDEHNDIHEAITQWRTAALLRETSGVEKKIMAPLSTFNFIQEFITLDDLDNVIVDQDAIRMQSLLICMRVLGPTHKDTIYRLMIRGAAYADSARYQRCIQLWLLALELRIRKDSILYNEVYFNSHALVKLLLDMLKFPIVEVKEIVLFSDVFRALTLIGDELEQSMKLLMIKPEYWQQQNNFDQALNVFICLLYVILHLAPSQQDMEILTSYLQKIVHLNPVTVVERFSLLHMSVSTNMKLAPPSGGALSSCATDALFPNCAVASLLLDCGANVNAATKQGCSPLFLASYSRHYRKEIVEMLLRRGAHVDQASSSGDHAGKILAKNAAFRNDDLKLPVSPLKCLAAQAVRRHGLAVSSRDLPYHLQSFINMH